MRARLSPILPQKLPRPVSRCNPRAPITARIVKSKSELLSLYNIEQPANLSIARSAAEDSVKNLSIFLNSRPVPLHTKAAFDSFMNWRARNSFQKPLCIDAGCGTGRSTKHLATLLPHCDVVGVEKSAARLSQTEAFRRYAGFPPGLDNALLLRADLIDFWRLCMQHRVFPDYHFILYPNPYPNATNFKVSFGTCHLQS